MNKLYCAVCGVYFESPFVLRSCPICGHELILVPEKKQKVEKKKKRKNKK